MEEVPKRRSGRPRKHSLPDILPPSEIVKKPPLQQGVSPLPPTKKPPKKDTLARFETIQKRLLTSLEERTKPDALAKMNWNDMTAALKTVRENIAQLRELNALGEGTTLQIVSSMPFEEDEEKSG